MLELKQRAIIKLMSLACLLVPLFPLSIAEGAREALKFLEVQEAAEAAEAAAGVLPFLCGLNTACQLWYCRTGSSNETNILAELQ